MVRRLCVLLLGAGFALAQEEKEDEGKDDEGISIDEAPAPEEPGAAPERTTAFPAREPGKKPAAVAIKEKIYSFTLPADWVVFKGDESNMELSREILLPGSTKRAFLALYRDDNVYDPRSAPHSKAGWMRKDKPDEKVEVRMKPCPRLVHYRFLHDTDWIDLFLWVSVRNNHYTFRLGCAAADFPQAEADMLATVQSFAATVEVWPPIPKGYEVSRDGTWLVARAPGVTASLAPLLAALREVEKRFRRDHGPLPKSDAPIVVLVHASQGDAARIEPRAAEGMKGFYSDIRHRRLFAAPLKGENLENQGWLAGDAQQLLFLARYGDTSPYWVCDGERTAARAEAMTGKPLPSLHEGFIPWISNLRLHTVPELEAMRAAEKPDWDTVGPECFFYVAMFRAGKYRKTYRAFLDDYAETADGVGAYARHFGTIDPEDLRTATNQFVSRIKAEKPKS